MKEGEKTKIIDDIDNEEMKKQFEPDHDPSQAGKKLPPKSKWKSIALGAAAVGGVSAMPAGMGTVSPEAAQTSDAEGTEDATPEDVLPQYEWTEAPEASTVNDDMSFGEAFAAARQELGAGGVFYWQGEPYHTFYASEIGEGGEVLIDLETGTATVADEEAAAEEVVAAEVVDDSVDGEEEVIAEAEPIGEDLADAEQVEVNVVDVTAEEVIDTDEVIAEAEIEDTVNTSNPNTFNEDGIMGIPEDVDLDAHDSTDDLANLDDDFEDLDSWA